MFHGDVHAVDIAQNAAAQLFHGLGKALDLANGSCKQLVKTSAECDVVGRNRRQHSRMIEGAAEGLFQFAHPRQNSRVDQRVEIDESLHVLAQRFKLPQ